MKKNLPLLLGLEGLCCAAYVLLGQALPDLFGTLVTFPWKQIGMLLRVLSLSGVVGNAAAILLYGLICLCPLGVMVWKAKIGFQWEDALLGILSVLLFPVMYLMVNPQLFDNWLGTVYGALGAELLAMVTYSVILGYYLLKVLRLCLQAGQARLLDYLNWLISGYCALLVLSACGLRLDALFTNIDAFRQANRGTLSGSDLTLWFLVAQYVMDILPGLLMIWVLLHARRVLALLKTQEYTEELVLQAESLSRKCVAMLTWVVAGNLGFNLIQLIFLKNLRNLSAMVRLPLGELCLVVALLLSARFIRSHKELRDENEGFI